MSTFVRKAGGSRFPYIKGTKPSLKSSQLLTSTGIPSFDAVLGGGIGSGTILLIESDAFQIYSDVLIRCFLGESIASDQPALICGPQLDDAICSRIPIAIDDEKLKDSKKSTIPAGGDMKIAWRYENLPMAEKPFGSETSESSGIEIGHEFDLTQSLPNEKCSEFVKKFDILNLNENWEEKIFSSLENEIHSFNSGISSDFSQTKKKNLIRLVFRDFSSTFWGENFDNLCQILYKIRCKLRSSFAVCLITISAQLLTESNRLRLRRLCDSVFELEDFTGSPKEANPLYADYQGLFFIHKLPTVNSIAPVIPECFDLAFKQRRRRFTIEKLHLPPDLSETASRTQTDAMSGCASALQKANLDF